MAEGDLTNEDEERSIGHVMDIDKVELVKCTILNIMVIKSPFL